MAIVTSAIWQSWANQTLSGGDLTSLGVICGQVDAAIKSKLDRTIEQATYTGLVFNAPPTKVFDLARYAPITVSNFALYYNANAQGNPSGFSSSDLLTMYTDYILDVGPDTQASSLSGLVINLKGAWGVQGWRPNYSIAFQTEGIPGSLQATFQGGYATVPNDLIEAACLAVSKIRQLRKLGSGVQSESWNGDSYSLGSGAFVNGILGDPVIAGLLNTYMNYSAVFG